MNARYEIRDRAAKASKKKWHVFDTVTGREVFHTDDRGRADRLVALAGSDAVTQHLKDHGHRLVSGDDERNCRRCIR